MSFLTKPFPFKEMGELEVDHRASPGLSEDIARQVGYVPELCGEGKVYRQHTMTCSHCRCSVVMNPFRTRERHRCFECDSKRGHYVCDGCAYLMTLPDYVHTPFEKVIERNQYAANLVGEGSPSKLILT